MLPTISQWFLKKNPTNDTVGHYQSIRDDQDFHLSSTRELNKTAVDLTVVGQTTLFTVPTGYDLYVTEVELEGKATQSGGTTSVLKIGTTDGSYAELCNGSSGHSFTSGTATTLLANGARAPLFDIYELSAMNAARTTKFASGSVIKADVSGGSPVTAGQVYVCLQGFLRPSGV